MLFLMEPPTAQPEDTLKAESEGKVWIKPKVALIVAAVTGQSRVEQQAFSQPIQQCFEPVCS